MVLPNHPNEALEDKKAALKCEYTRMAEGDDKLYRKSFVAISTYAFITTGVNGLQH